MPTQGEANTLRASASAQRPVELLLIGDERDVEGVVTQLRKGGVVHCW